MEEERNPANSAITFVRSKFKSFPMTEENIKIFYKVKKGSS